MKLPILKPIKLILASAALVCIGGLQSCMPQTDINSSNVSPGDTNTVPDPENTKTFILYKDNASNIVGLYFSPEGAITSRNGWSLAPVGWVSCVGKIDYIPFYNWGDILTVKLGDGFVGYHESQGFVRFYVGATQTDPNNGNTTALGLVYAGPYYGLDQEITVDKTDLLFNATGGSQSIKTTNETYTEFRVSSSADWCEVEKTPMSAFRKIYDGIEITAEPNPTDDARFATVTIRTIAGKTTTITVVQE